MSCIINKKLIIKLFLKKYQNKIFKKWIIFIKTLYKGIIIR